MVSVTQQGATRNLFLSFPHNRNATDVSLIYEASSDLQTWTATQPQLISDIITSSETEQITVRFSSAASLYFVRVRATRNGP